jgi:hypothetical protein
MTMNILKGKNCKISSITAIRAIIAICLFFRIVLAAASVASTAASTSVRDLRLLRHHPESNFQFLFQCKFNYCLFSQIDLIFSVGCMIIFNGHISFSLSYVFKCFPSHWFFVTCFKGWTDILPKMTFRQNAESRVRSFCRKNITRLLT